MHRAYAAVCAACVALSVSASDEDLLTAISFAPPFTAINQFSGMRHIEGWDVGGSAQVHRSFVRLTPERQGQKGWMFSHTPFHLREWSAMLEIRASGASPHLYGDGERTFSVMCRHLVVLSQPLCWWLQVLQYGS